MIMPKNFYEPQPIGCQSIPLCIHWWQNKIQLILVVHVLNVLYSPNDDVAIATVSKSNVVPVHNIRTHSIKYTQRLLFMMHLRLHDERL